MIPVMVLANCNLVPAKIAMAKKTVLAKNEMAKKTALASCVTAMKAQASYVTAKRASKVRANCAKAN